MNNLASTIEALLFALGKPLSVRELATHTGTDEDEIRRTIPLLAHALQGHGMTIVHDGTTLELRVAPEAAEVVAKARNDDLTRELGKAGLETIALLLYRGPQTRSEIDYARGVNSTQILRTLQMRGLIRKAESGRAPRYEVTTELLATLGITHESELPEYQSLRTELAALVAAAETSTDAA